MKFKELDEKKHHQWIMLVNAIIPANFTLFCILVVGLIKNIALRVKTLVLYLTFYTITDVAWLSSALVAKCLINFKKGRNFFFKLRLA